MSAKRSLYKPAPAAVTPKQTARRCLPQGRLTSTDPRSVLIEGSPYGSIAKQTSIRTATLGSRARRTLNYNKVSEVLRDAHTPSQQISPTIAHSPAKVQPSASLSLSETEDEPRRLEDGPKKQEGNCVPALSASKASVLSVDAKHRHSSHANKEVPITASYIKSPAKVVCHSPKRRTTSQMPGSPQYGSAGKITIPVERIPSVKIISDSAVLHADESQSTCSPPPSEDGSSLSTVAGSPVDPRSKAVETVVVREKNNPRSYVSFLDDGSDMSAPFDQSEVHVGQPKFDDTGLSSIASTSRLDSGIEVTRKKKKKTRVVQSKYMTSAMSRIPDNKLRAEEQSSRNTVASRTSLKARKTTKSGNASKALTKDVAGNESIVRNAKKPLHSSTPAEVAQRAVTTITEDEPSNIVRDTDRGDLLPPAHFAFRAEQTRTKTNKDTASSKEIKSERSAQQANVGEISQLQLDLQYAELCQWRFLRLKEKDAFKKQEKDVQEWFYSMSQLDDEMSQRNHELELNLATKKKEGEIDRQLEIQLSVLRKLDAQSRRLFPAYNKLFEGIDTTRHHMPVNEMLVPQNEAELLAALNEYESNVEEILELLEGDESKILLFSDEMQALAETVQSETAEHERCTELLAAANSLATHEQSLLAELLQRNEC